MDEGFNTLCAGCRYKRDFQLAPRRTNLLEWMKVMKRRVRRRIEKRQAEGTGWHKGTVWDDNALWRQSASLQLSRWFRDDLVCPVSRRCNDFLEMSEGNQTHCGARLLSLAACCFRLGNASKASIGTEGYTDSLVRLE